MDDYIRSFEALEYKGNQLSNCARMYHYTSKGGLEGMLSSLCVWMTHSDYLNDTQEIQHGLRMLCGLAMKSKNDDLILASHNFSNIISNSKAFVASFSEEADMLSQWRGYCPKEGGFCLELKKPSDTHCLCVYKEDEKIDILNGLINNLIKNGRYDQYALNAMIKTIVQMKHVGFAEEKEVRLIRFAHESILYRKDDRFEDEVPYIKWKIDPNDILAIWIGPCNDYTKKEEWLNSYLDDLLSKAHIQNKPEIKRSRIPYRC